MVTSLDILGGTIDDVKYFIEKENFDVNKKCGVKGSSPVALVTMMPDEKIDIIEYLAKQGADLEARDNDGNSPMDTAAIHGKINIIKCLARCGAKVDARNNDGQTPLFIAALMGETKSIKCLASLGADLNAPDNNGLTPMFGAAQAGQVEAIKCLAALGVDVDAKDKRNGATPISMAAHAGVIECLVALGANVNATANNGMTAIFPIAAGGQLDSIKCLVAHGAKININIKGITPLSLATKFGHTDVVEWLSHKDKEVLATEHVEQKEQERARIEKQKHLEQEYREKQELERVKQKEQEKKRVKKLKAGIYPIIGGVLALSLLGCFVFLENVSWIIALLIIYVPFTITIIITAIILEKKGEKIDPYMDISLVCGFIYSIIAMIITHNKGIFESWVWSGLACFATAFVAICFGAGFAPSGRYGDN